MIDYMVNGRTFQFSYRLARDAHQKFVAMTDERFLANLRGALHLAVYVCWVKEAHAQAALADDGVIHELVHLLLEETPVHPDGLHGVRALFATDLALA